MYLYVCILYYYSSTTIEKQSASLLLNSVNVDRLEQTLKDKKIETFPDTSNFKCKVENCFIVHSYTA